MDANRLVKILLRELGLVGDTTFDFSNFDNRLARWAELYVPKSKAIYPFGEGIQRSPVPMFRESWPIKPTTNVNIAR